MKRCGGRHTRGLEDSDCGADEEESQVSVQKAVKEDSDCGADEEESQVSVQKAVKEGAARLGRRSMPTPSHPSRQEEWPLPLKHTPCSRKRILSLGTIRVNVGPRHESISEPDLCQRDTGL